MGSQTEGKPRPLVYLTVGLATFDHPDFSKLYGDTDAIALWLFLSVEACKTQGIVTSGIIAKAGPVIGSKRRVASAIERLLVAGPLASVGAEYAVAGWKKYQTDGWRRPSDEPEATRERKRRSRAKAAAKAAAEAPVTPLSRYVTRDCHARREEEQSSSLPRPPARESGAAGGAEPTDNRSFAEKLGVTKDEILGPLTGRRRRRQSAS